MIFRNYKNVLVHFHIGLQVRDKFELRFDIKKMSRDSVLGQGFSSLQVSKLYKYNIQNYIDTLQHVDLRTRQFQVSKS